MAIALPFQAQRDPNQGESGIYAIINTGTGDFYIGSSVSMRRRWNQHRLALRKGCNYCGVLQHAWNKYGADAFSFYVIEYVIEHANLIEREQHYLDMFHPTYNIRKVADRNTGIRRGTLSEETRAKIRAALLGKPSHKHTPESRAKISASHRERGMTQAQLTALHARKGTKHPTAGAKIADKLQGRPLTEAHKQQLHELHKATRSRLATPEGKQQRSDQMKRAWAGGKFTPRKFSEEEKKKRSEAFRNNPSVVARTKAMSEANRGRVPTPEHREKIRQAHLRRFAEKRQLAQQVNVIVQTSFGEDESSG